MKPETTRASRATASRTAQLVDADVAADFYEDRYAQGYMESWPLDKRQRIAETVRSLMLPAHGRAIDFGCGNGVLTEVLREALPPGWEVAGCDISPTAIAHARQRLPGCRFALAGDPQWQGQRFDLLFSHHVLEHVHDLDQVLAQAEDLLAEQAHVLHVLPCGNPGSLEHGVAASRRDGIDAALEGRFFYEDEGHVRRLTTAQLAQRMAGHGHRLRQAWYSHQHHGAIDWLTQAGPGFLRRFTDPRTALDTPSRAHLQRLRRQLFLRWVLRYPAAFVDSRWHKPRRSALETALCVLGAPLALLARPMDRRLRRLAEHEWRMRRHEPNGSEMFLCFERGATAPEDTRDAA